MSKNSIGTCQLCDGSVTKEKMARNSVGALQLCEGSIDKESLAANSVGTDQLCDKSVTETKLGGATKGSIFVGGDDECWTQEPAPGLDNRYLVSNTSDSTNCVEWLGWNTESIGPNVETLSSGAYFWFAASPVGDTIPWNPLPNFMTPEPVATVVSRSVTPSLELQTPPFVSPGAPAFRNLDGVVPNLLSDTANRWYREIEPFSFDIAQVLLDALFALSNLSTLADFTALLTSDGLFSGNTIVLVGAQPVPCSFFISGNASWAIVSNASISLPSEARTITTSRCFATISNYG